MFNNLKKKLHYLGNTKIKASGVPVELTPEQIQELVKCEADPIYFINNYMKIVSLDKGLIQCELYPYQEKMITSWIKNRWNINMLSRQSGKTTAYVGFVLWYSIFNESKNIIILANKAKTARGILARIKLAYENLPMWLQVGVEEYNKGSVIFGNKSKIVADSTSGSAARSESVNVLILDEFAFVPRNIAEEFIKSAYPTISASETSKIIMVSTPNGLNLFAKYWSDAIKGINGYIPFTMHWSEVPGRDEKWKDETIKNIGLEAFNQEYNCEFIGSVSDTLIASQKLRILQFNEPIERLNNVKIFEKPIAAATYLMMVDTARGEGNDYSAFTVAKISELPYKIVATYKSNEIATMDLPNVIVPIAKIFNESFILVESNDTGSQVADILKYEFEYENLIGSALDKKLPTLKVSFGFLKRDKLGVRMTRSVRRIGCNNLKSLIENNQLIFEDFDIVSELTTFINRNGKFIAESGTNDDLVMTLVMFGWITGQKLFNQLTDTTIRETLNKEKEELNDNTPLIVYDNHQFDDNQKNYEKIDDCVWEVIGENWEEYYARKQIINSKS